MKENARKDTTRAASRRTGASDYVVFVSSAENHVSAIWKDIGGEEGVMPKHRESQIIPRWMRGSGVGRRYVAVQHGSGIIELSPNSPPPCIVIY